MSSGNKRIVVNLKERAYSPDVNRLQAFAAADLANMLRYIYEPQVTERSGYGNEIITTSPGNPARGVIFNGLRPQPVNGSVNMSVSPGAVLLIDPDAVPDADDSVGKYIVSVGRINPNYITLPPNSIGNANQRTVIIECTRLDTLVESAARDIFDPATETFSNNIVEKVRAGTLDFRVREHTNAASSDFPGFASRWLPLAVGIVAPGSVDWDTVELWDVRPLLNSFAGAPFQEKREWTRNGPAYLYADAADGVLKGQVFGETQYFKMGGALDATGIDFFTPDPDIAASGFAFAASKTWYLWNVFPYRLPRWCKYLSSGARVPGSWLGMPVISSRNPTTWTALEPNADITPSTKYQGISPAFNTTDDDFGLIFAGPVQAGGTPAKGARGDGKEVRFNTAATHAATSITATDVTWSLDEADLWYPRNARSIRCKVSATYTNSAGADELSKPFYILKIEDHNGTVDIFEEKLTPSEVTVPALGFQVVQFEFRVPIPPVYPHAHLGAPYVRDLIWNYVQLSTNVTLTAATLSILGWELAP